MGEVRDTGWLALEGTARTAAGQGVGMMTLIGFGSFNGDWDLAAGVRCFGGTAFFLAAVLPGAGFALAFMAGTFRSVVFAPLTRLVAAAGVPPAGGAVTGRAVAGRLVTVVAGGGEAAGADAGGAAAGVATDPAEMAVVVDGCCVPLVLPNRPAMNGLPMHS